MKVKIITDVISDISPDVAYDYNIEVMPIKITIDGKHMNLTDISVEGLVEWVEENKKIPSFKGVSCDEYVKTYGKYVNQGYAIVCLTAGSQAISNFDCALYASTQFPNANIQVVNTNRFSGNVGLLAILAAKMAMNKRSANEIAIACERNIEKNKQTSLMHSTSFMKYAVTEPKILAAGTNLLNAKFTTMDKAINNFCNKVFKNIDTINPEVLFMTYTISDENYVSQVYKRASELGYFEDIILCKSSHFNTCFVGPDCMSVTYQMK